MIIIINHKYHEYIFDIYYFMIDIIIVRHFFNHCVADHVKKLLLAIEEFFHFSVVSVFLYNIESKAVADPIKHFFFLAFQFFLFSFSVLLHIAKIH
jgi:hypothetical protein